MVSRPWPRRVAPEAGRPDLVEQPGEHGIDGAQVRERRLRIRPDRAGRTPVRAQGWPSAPPGTPVFVEYLGWIFISGRMACTACETAIAASA